jgi:hypothetical protein
MQPYTKYESTGPLQFLGALSQATPSITPSNFQSINRSPPKIFGRKVDSPTLLVVNETNDDFEGQGQFEFANVADVQDLNKTNKIYSKKPLEYVKKGLNMCDKEKVATI